jgi:hypothetical protein
MTSADERLRIAGDAAAILDAMGYTSVARLREGIVTLDLWRMIGTKQVTLRHVVEDDLLSARVLAESCAAEFRFRTSQ